MIDNQTRAIFWAQWRSLRNRLPRSDGGTILLGGLVAVWYGFFAALAAVVASLVKEWPGHNLPQALSLGVLGLFVFWQVIPLMTLSSGWTIDIAKLLIYPIPPTALFRIEASLRFTASPELTLLLLGGIAGLLMRPGFRFVSFALLLTLPLSVFLSLFLHHLLTQTLARKRRKELIAALLINLALLPSFLLGTPAAKYLNPIFVKLAAVRFTPWQTIARLSLGTGTLLEAAVAALYLLAAFLLAWRQFARSFASQDIQVQSRTESTTASWAGRLAEAWFRTLEHFFPDPLAALIEKELRMLVRSPRFRIVFGMACFFSAVVFLPFFSSGDSPTGFLPRNYLPAVSVYGLLLIGETILWNIFGFDRKAAQIYYLAPVPLRTVIHAKNAATGLVIAVMTLLIAAIGAVLRRNVSAGSVAGSVLLTAVMTLFFMGFGNLASVQMPRPVHPDQVLRKQNSASASLFLLVSLLVLAVPVGAAFLAAWALETAWPFYTILVIDLIIAAITYRMATESAVERAERHNEKILERLWQETTLIR
jgi:ABC-2 type transport system permease protein